MSTFDNLIWHSLSSVHASLAKVAPGARCYDASFAPIAGVEDETDLALTSLASLLETDARVTLFLQSEPRLPASLLNAFIGPLVQMICEKPQPARSVQFTELGTDDVEEMIRLAEICKIGLFSPRTVELGSYLGVWNDKQLVAMAGERLQTEEFVEISAVCTHPDFRGQGYSKGLLHEICSRILASGRVPILPVRPDNVSAVRTYQSLGFTKRRSFRRFVLKKTNGNDPACDTVKLCNDSINSSGRIERDGYWQTMKTFFALIIGVMMLAEVAPASAAITDKSVEIMQKTGVTVQWDEDTYQQYSTQDKLGRTITFYVTPPGKYAQPLAVFLNGSGFGSVFYKKDGHIRGQYAYFEIIAALRGRARLVLVEKPGVKLFDTPKTWGSCIGAPEKFLKEQTVERYTEAVNAAIRAAEQLPGVDTTRLLVMGHSEGAEMAAHIAGSNDSVTHVACLAGVGTSQLFDFVTMVSDGTMDCPGKTPSDKIEYTYQKWREIQTDPNSVTKFYEGHPYRRWYSFWSHTALDDLLKTQAKIYIAKGTADRSTSITAFEVVRSELLSHGKVITAERIEGADHGFRKKGVNGVEDELPGLLRRVANWYLQ